jgi:hypothetical protein
VAYNTKSTDPFSDLDAWNSFDLGLLFSAGGSATTGVAPGFVGAAFDGERLFLAPAGNLARPNGSAAPLPVVAYDTTKLLASASSYSVFDPSVMNGGATAFEGAAFDGQYVYFVPHGHSVVARFKAKKAPGPLSPANIYTGSWW